MKVSDMQSSFTLNQVDAQQLELLNAKLTFKVTHLKSDNSGLDEKAHEALKAEKHQMITFTQTEKIVVTLSQNQFKSKVRGNLNIAGSTKQVELEIEGEQLPDGSLRVKGEKALKMTTFGVTPPKAMLGAIRSGDDIVVRFDVTFK
jgi:polyisoprenoid-binding protein YceI